LLHGVYCFGVGGDLVVAQEPDGSKGDGGEEHECSYHRYGDFGERTSLTRGEGDFDRLSRRGKVNLGGWHGVCRVDDLGTIGPFVVVDLGDDVADVHHACFFLRLLAADLRPEGGEVDFADVLQRVEEFLRAGEVGPFFGAELAAFETHFQHLEEHGELCVILDELIQALIVLLLEVLAVDVRVGISLLYFDGHLSRDGLEQHDADCEEVHFGGCRLVRELELRHVHGGSAYTALPVLGLIDVVTFFLPDMGCCAEVDDARGTIFLADDDVLRFQVAVDALGAVHEMHCVEEAQEEPHNILRFRHFFIPEFLFERLTFDVRQHDVAHAVVIAELKCSGDLGDAL